MTSKAKLALIAAVAAVSVVSPALAQAGVHHVRRNGLHAYAMEPHSAPRACLSIQTIRRSLAAAALATTNCCSRKVTDHSCTKKVGRTRFAPLSLQSVGPNRSAPSAIASPFDGNWERCSPDHPTP